jgi:hypothetical protein
LVIGHWLGSGIRSDVYIRVGSETGWTVFRRVGETQWF